MPSLRSLLDSQQIEVAAVVTNPDKPADRGLERKPSPVKELALEAGLEVLQPARVRDAEIHARLAELDVDVAAVVAYGKILPVTLLDLPARGFVNLHFSLLPEYRGAAPVQRAIMDGATVTGVSTMVLTEGMDGGPVLARLQEEVRPNDTAGTLGERLARRGAGLLVRSLIAYVEGTAEPEPQDHSAATYAPKITTEQARIDWSAPAEAIRNHVRALNPAPGAWTILRSKRVKIWSADSDKQKSALAPGALCEEDGLVAGTGTSTLLLQEVQMEGRRRMTGAELARGLHLVEAERFE